jgi:hypothetical protein
MIRIDSIRSPIIRGYLKYLLFLACLVAAFIAGVSTMTATAIGVCTAAFR